MQAPTCKCAPAQPSLRFTVRVEGPNLNRPFYGCAKGRAGCKFFQWIDEPVASAPAAASAANAFGVVLVPRPASMPQPVIREPEAPAAQSPATEAPSGSGGGSDGVQIVCKCSVAAVERIVRKEGVNKNKKFYACAKGQSDPTACGFFMWQDDADKRRNDPLAPQSSVVLMHEEVYQRKRRREPLDAPALEPAAASSTLKRKDEFERRPRSRADLATEALALLAEQHGYTVRLTSPYEHVFQHTDLLWCGARRRPCVAVNVQHAKRLAPADAAVQYAYHWLQLHGAAADDDGWLCGDGARADLVALEQRDGFYLLDAVALCCYVESMCTDAAVYTLGALCDAAPSGPQVADAEHAARANLLLYKRVRSELPHGSPNEVRVLVSVEALRTARVDVPTMDLQRSESRAVVLDYWPLSEVLAAQYRARLPPNAQ